jgi:hypothetical protein
MNLEKMWAFHVKDLVPLYYFEIHKIKRVNKQVWVWIPKVNNAFFKKDYACSFKRYKSALKRVVDCERLVTRAALKNKFSAPLPLHRQFTYKFWF